MTTLLLGLIELGRLSQKLCLFCLGNIMREREREREKDIKMSKIKDRYQTTKGTGINVS